MIDTFSSYGFVNSSWVFMLSTLWYVYFQVPGPGSYKPYEPSEPVNKVMFP